MIQLSGTASGTNIKSGRQVSLVEICQEGIEKTSGHEICGRFTPFRRSSSFFSARSAASTERSGMPGPRTEERVGMCSFGDMAVVCQSLGLSVPKGGRQDDLNLRFLLVCILLPSSTPASSPRPQSLPHRLPTPSTRAGPLFYCRNNLNLPTPQQRPTQTSSEQVPATFYTPGNRSRSIRKMPARLISLSPSSPSSSTTVKPRRLSWSASGIS